MKVLGEPKKAHRTNTEKHPPCSKYCNFEWNLDQCCTLRQGMIKNAMHLDKNKPVPLKDINTTNHVGQTPLHVAVAESSLSLVRAMVACGADLSPVDLFGHTPLSLAVDSCNHDIMKLLLSTGADTAKANIFSQ